MDRFRASGLVSSILRFALHGSYGTEDDVQMERSCTRIGSWIYVLLYKPMSIRIIPDSMIYVLNISI
jgi:hypothetical protein